MVGPLVAVSVSEEGPHRNGGGILLGTACPSSGGAPALLPVTPGVSSGPSSRTVCPSCQESEKSRGVEGGVGFCPVLPGLCLPHEPALSAWAPALPA